MQVIDGWYTLTNIEANFLLAVIAGDTMSKHLQVELDFVEHVPSYSDGNSKQA